MIDAVEFAIIADQEGYDAQAIRAMWERGLIEHFLKSRDAGRETVIATLRATLQLIKAWSRGVPERFARTERMVLVSVRDGGALCAYCDLNLDLYDSYHYPDHVVPKSRFTHGSRPFSWDCMCGCNDLDNMVNACRDCNVLKGQYVPKGDSLAERRADAKRFVESRRHARAETNLPGILRELIERRQPCTG
jgi:5-methylcytosine-specific restriction endonuclease McrA